MRISTAQIFGSGIDTLQRQQADLLRTQQQMASGKRLLTPADDPAAAVQALQLHDRVASVEQYARNAEHARTRLGQEEAVLGTMADSLHRVRELAVQAANGTQTDESRQAIARELRQISAGLLDAANSRAAGGEHLFAGYRSGSPPFLRGPDGSVEYRGDRGQREVLLSSDSSVAVGDSGAELMTIPRGNGSFTVTPDAANAGTGRVAGADLVDPAAFTREPYTLAIVGADAYEILDAGNNVVAAGAYASGQGVDFGGMRIVLEGTPADGDTFAIEPAGATSLFAVVDELAAALETPAADAADRAIRTHRIGTALLDIDQAIGRVLDLRADVGARMNRIDGQAELNADQSLTLETALSAVEDLDYAEAVSRFHLQQTALQVAQQTYAQTARLSLFDWLR